MESGWGLCGISFWSLINLPDEILGVKAVGAVKGLTTVLVDYCTSCAVTMVLGLDRMH